MLPTPLRTELETVLKSAIRQERALGGGCISNATRVETEDGRRVVAKWGKRAEFERGLFAAEAEALRVLGEGGEVRVPEVLGVSDDGDRYSWLLLEWLAPGRATDHGWESLGRSLAQLHRRQHETFGWHSANFIGSLPQSNNRSSDWPDFWRDERIAPQLHGLGHAERRRASALLERAHEILAVGNEEGPSLLHGDLWGGNVHALEEGNCALIDPSAYYGHREVDLAMATLFGGFSDRFFAAYNEAWPLLPEYERRRYFYQLYYMLVHVNLFGASYIGGTVALLGKLGF